MFSRRSFLRGLGGVTLALPVLDSLGRSSFAAAPTGVCTRFVCFFTCNGVNMETFWPSSYGPVSGASFSGTSLEPIAGHASRLLIPRGIHKVPKGFGWEPTEGDDHNNGMAGKLTAQPIQGGFAAGISVDQAIADALNPPNTGALTLMVGPRDPTAGGYISYRHGGVPVTAENNPWLAYQDLIGLDGLEDQARQRLIARRESVLDLVRVEYEALLSRDLSSSDREKLDMHFTAVRDLENALGDEGLIPCTLDPDTLEELEGLDPSTISYDSEYKRVGRLQMDVLAMAIACGRNRSATLMWGTGAGGPTFTWDGMNHEYNHHKLSHGNTADDCSGSGVPGYEQMLTDIDRWYAEQFGYLLDKLAAYQEGEGTVLDNSAVLWANELSHGKDHDFRDLPFVLAGSAGGYFKQGEYIKVTAGNQWGDPDDTRNDNDAPHNKLLTTLLNGVGVRDGNGDPITRFGHPGYGAAGEFDLLKA